MAGYRDWLNIDNPNNMGEEQLKQAIRSMGNAANKRLKRMENRGIDFGEDDGPNTTAGVKRFTVRGKSLDELKREFKRVRNFLSNPQSSLTGMRKALEEFKQKVKSFTKKETKEFAKMKRQKKSMGVKRDSRQYKWEELRQWRETWRIYNRLKNEGYYTPSEYDSSQTRDTILAYVKMQDEMNLSDNETWKRILNSVVEDYETRKQAESHSDDVSTSSLINKGVDLGPSD